MYEVTVTTGRIWNFHPLESCAARRTHKKAVITDGFFRCLLSLFIITIY